MATNRTQNETLLALQGKQELDKELQKLGRQKIVSKEYRVTDLNDLLTDKNIRQQKDFSQAGKKDFRVSAGYVAKEKYKIDIPFEKNPRPSPKVNKPLEQKTNITPIIQENVGDIKNNAHIQQQQNKISTPNQIQKPVLPEVNKPQVITINPNMLNAPEIKQAMLGFKNLVNRPLPIELKRQKKGVAYKIKDKLSNIKHKVKKVLGR